MTQDTLAAVRALRGARDAERADEYLAKARALARERPDDVLARVEAAYACDRAGHEAEAATHYDAAMKLGGVPAAERPGFLLGYGSTLRNVGRLDEARAVLRAAAREFPDDRALRAFLSLALHDGGEHAEAVATLLDVALSLAPHAPELARFERPLALYRDALRAGAAHAAAGSEVEYQLSTSPLGSALLGDAMDLHRRVLGDDVESVLQEMRGRPGLLLLVARAGGRAVGYKLGYERKPRHFYSWLGGVDPAHRSRGIATELMRRQHRWCRDHGYEAVRTIASNAHRAMLQLDLASGFDVIGTLVDPRGGGARVVMEKRLLDAK